MIGSLVEAGNHQHKHVTQLTNKAGIVTRGGAPILVENFWHLIYLDFVNDRKFAIKAPLTRQRECKRIDTLCTNAGAIRSGTRGVTQDWRKG